MTFFEHILSKFKHVTCALFCLSPYNGNRQEKSEVLLKKTHENISLDIKRHSQIKRLTRTLLRGRIYNGCCGANVFQSERLTLWSVNACFDTRGFAAPSVRLRRMPKQALALQGALRNVCTTTLDTIT